MPIKNRNPDNNPEGRPLKFKSVEELDKKIEAYFKSCYAVKTDDVGIQYKANIVPLTVSGLALALDTTRVTLLDYGAKDEYSYSIRKAKARIENFAECSLWEPKIAQGVMFNLKNNHARWTDRQEIVTTNNNITVSLDDEDN